MSNPADNGIHLTKGYFRKNFQLSDFQWSITKVDDDFTLYDLFRLVNFAERLSPKISDSLGMSQFKLFWDQINTAREPDDKDDVTHLELYWSPDYDMRETKKTGKSTDQSHGRFDENIWDEPKICEMPNLMCLHGVGPGCPSAAFHECNSECPKTTGYAIEFTPVNNLAHLPIRVSPNVEFFPPYVESDRDFHATGFQLKIEPTLWCFITSVFWELTFMGSTPVDISDKNEYLLELVQNIREDLSKDENNDTGAQDEQR